MPAVTTQPQTATTTEEPWIPAPLYRMTLDQYEAMVASGSFSGKERFHLINGYLVAKMTQDEPHATADEHCGAALSQVVPHGWHVRAAKPTRIPATESKPEPDRCVARGTIRDHAGRSPEPADISLVVEVSDSSVGEDRRQAVIYSGGGIPIYWIVNVVDRQVEVSASPARDGYQTRQVFPAGSEVPVSIDGTEVARLAVNDLLP